MDNYHDGSQHLFVGDRIPLRAEDVRIGARYRKVDKEFCFHERPWIIGSDKPCPEGEVVVVFNIVQISGHRELIVVVITHDKHDGSVVNVSSGWLSWFVHCFQEVEETLEFESVDQAQIGPREAPDAA